MYVIGKTGTGKSTLLEAMIRQDINNGQGLALLDPHGDLVEKIVSQIPKDRVNDLIYFNVPDIENPMGFNPLERVVPRKTALAASGLLEVFKKIWLDSWGPRTEHFLRNVLLTLLEQPCSTLADVPRLFADGEFRKRALDKISNSQVRDFWLKEYAGYPPRFRAEAIAPIQNKVGAFLTDPILNRIITQPKSSFDLRQVIDTSKILLVNLSKGKIGETASSLLGSLLTARIGLAALSRADQPEEERRDFYLYLDEFQAFTTLSLANMLAELRKFRVNLTLVSQSFSQLEVRLKEAVLSNVGTFICFRTGISDAQLLAQEFEPDFSVSDFINLPNYEIILQLMIDGRVSRPFSGETISFISSNSVQLI